MNASDAVARLNEALSGRYRVERELGEGGMATVYLAEDVKHGRKVALKVLKPELAAVVGGERFLAEIETTAKLQHPNILPLFDSGEADSFLFYVMPYVEGESLRERLERDRQLPIDEAVRFATEVAEALHSAHQYGVVHRDIKPANLMVTQGRPMIADFGIALALSSAGGHRLTETGLSVGTPHYMSPEQATGDQPVGPPSDIYSLGCVLYEMLVGEPPYTGGTAQAILGKVITSEPTRVTEQRKAVPPHVDAVVSKALEKVPADRFATAADFAASLGDEGFRHGVAPAAARAATARLRAAAVTGWGLAIVASVGWALGALSTEPPPEVRRFSLTYPEQTGPSEWLALTPDGSALIMSDKSRAASNRSSPFSLTVVRFSDMTRTTIPGSAEGFDPFVSPDGDLVAFGGFDAISVAALDGSPAEAVADEGGWGLRWGSDGSLYFSSIPTDEGMYIAKVPSGGGEVERVLDSGEGELLGYFQPVGDGSRAVFGAFFEADDESGTIEWFDLETSDRTVITDGVRPFLADDVLVFGRGESVYAARIDLGTLELLERPVRVIERVGTTDSDGMFALSSSGDLVYWTPVEEREPVRELIWVSRDGTATSVDPEWLRRFEGGIDLSPDGKRAVVAITRAEDGASEWLDTEIWIKDLEDGAQRRITNFRGMNYRPVWSADGASIAFISNRDGRYAVYTMPVDGIGAPTLLYQHPDRDIDEAFWSPDGDWLVYRAGTTDGDRDIYARRLRPDTGTIVISALADVDEVAPTLSPNGRWLAYVSTESGENEVYVRPFPDVGQGSRRVSQGGRATGPVWSDDGTELFFRSADGRASLEITNTEAFETGALRRLYLWPTTGWWWNRNHRLYSYDARGDRFLQIRTVEQEAQPAQLVLVQNFIEEVRARLDSR